MAALNEAWRQGGGIVGGLGLLMLVGYADFVTGYQFTLVIFYLLPILCVLRYAGPVYAIGMAFLATAVWLAADYSAGQRYSSSMTPVWNATICLAIFLLVIVLFHSRQHIQNVVDERTESLRQEILRRTQLEREISAVADAEQQRIAHDLHDSLGQHLTATAMAVKILSQRAAGGGVLDPALATRTENMLEQAIKMTRNLARGLHPINLGPDGLTDALQDLAATLSEAFNVSCQFNASGVISLPDPKTGIHLYRIAQEAAGNAIRHGRARQVQITLVETPDHIKLTITDDGCGLAPEPRQHRGMGMRIMAYRADLLGARFAVQNLPAGGAQATCTLDLKLTEYENRKAKKKHHAGG